METAPREILGFFPCFFSSSSIQAAAAAEVREGLSAFVRGRELKGEKTDAQAALVGKGRRRKERKEDKLPPRSPCCPPRRDSFQSRRRRRRLKVETRRSFVSPPPLDPSVVGCEMIGVPRRIARTQLATI